MHSQVLILIFHKKTVNIPRRAHKKTIFTHKNGKTAKNRENTVGNLKNFEKNFIKHYILCISHPAQANTIC